MFDPTKIDFNTIISTKPFPDSYTQQILDNIKMVTFTKDDYATPFGSYIYRIQKYPGDIDLIESFKACCNIDDVVDQFSKRLKVMAKKIVSSRLHYMSEFKMGLDNRYIIDIGKLENGIYNVNKNLLKISKNMLNNKLLNRDEYNKIMLLISSNDKSPYAYDIINNIFRERRVLRWTDKEILQGYKILPKNLKITVKQALKIKTNVKIDMILLINNKFVELTNFILLVVEKRGQQPYIYNMDHVLDEDFFIERMEFDLPVEIEKLFYSKYYYNPFKGTKRLWALTRHYKDKGVIDRLVNFISGNISLLYQLKSEVDTIMLLLKRLKSIPKVSIDNQLNEIKTRISYVLEIQDPEIFYDWLNEAIKVSDKDKKLKILAKVKKHMSEYINWITMGYLKKVGLFPIPRNYLPPQLSYIGSNIDFNPLEYEEEITTIEDPLSTIEPEEEINIISDDQSSSTEEDFMDELEDQIDLQPEEAQEIYPEKLSRADFEELGQEFLAGFNLLKFPAFLEQNNEIKQSLFRRYISKIEKMFENIKINPRSSISRILLNMVKLRYSDKQKQALINKIRDVLIEKLLEEMPNLVEDIEEYEKGKEEMSEEGIYDNFINKLKKAMSILYNFLKQRTTVNISERTFVNYFVEAASRIELEDNEDEQILEGFLKEIKEYFGNYLNLKMSQRQKLDRILKGITSEEESIKILSAMMLTLYMDIIE